MPSCNEPSGAVLNIPYTLAIANASRLVIANDDVSRNCSVMWRKTKPARHRGRGVRRTGSRSRTLQRPRRARCAVRGVMILLHRLPLRPLDQAQRRCMAELGYEGPAGFRLG